MISATSMLLLLGWRAGIAIILGGLVLAGFMSAVDEVWNYDKRHQDKPGGRWGV